MKPFALVLGAALCLFVLESVPATATQYPPTAGSFTRSTGMIGGRPRSFFLYEPRNLKPGAPLVFVFHGGGGDGGEAREGSGGEFEMLADRYGFVVAYPDGIARSWNGCRKMQNETRERRGIDDVGFVDAMIAQEIASHHIDPKHVFAVGHSNGGALAYRLILERPEKFAGIAAISSNLPAPDNMDCQPMPAPRPVMVINGTADPVNPYNGGTNARGTSRGRVLSTDQTMQYFAMLNGINDAPQTARLPHQSDTDKTWVEQVAWTAPGKPSVVLYTVHGGGHVVPQPYYRFPNIVGAQTKDLDAPTVIWDFFMRETGLGSGLGAEQIQ
ncbi:MAG TPA: alpha/beta fold hydrolase [Micropepsaceae bacterium]|nr:alpha/beta fold hydrolase [Micropepsaceae bacterium]